MNETWIPRRLHYVVNMMSRHPCLLFCCVLVCSAVGFTWYSCRGENISVFPRHWPLFTSKAKVHEIPNGSLDTLSSYLDHSPLKFVLFYAPWCGQSRNVVPHFARAANILHQEVTFIAINCWTGSCKEKYVLDSFPKLFAYHTDFPGVQYPKDYDYHSAYMIRFLQDVVRPFLYITREKDLQDVKTNKQEVILSYLDNCENRDYLRFFGAALLYVGEVSRPLFGLITDVNLANEAGLRKTGEISFYRVLNPTLEYNPTVNTTVQNITDWISKNRKQLIVELIPKPTNRNALESKLTEKPAVILFLPLRRYKISSPLLMLYTQVATRYHNCSCTNKTKEEQQNIQAQSSQEEIMPFSTVDSNDIHPSRTLKEHDSRREYLCGSLIVKDKMHKRWNVCDICSTRGSHYQYGDVYDVMHNWLHRNHLSVSSCSSLQTAYYPVMRMSVCCGLQTQSTQHHEMALLRKRFQFSNNQILQWKVENLFDSLYYKLLKAIKPFKNGGHNNENVFAGLVATREELTGKLSLPPAAVSTGSVDNYSIKPNISVKTTETASASDGCNRTGHVTLFHGASCHSNRSVSFFYMDAGRFWSVAQRLGVKGSPADLKEKVALAVVDVKNEVYHVLDEEFPINNNTIVEFVMHFMNTRLKQTLRSAATPSNTCPEPHACVLEVTSVTLDDIVMDNEKVQALEYRPNFMHVYFFFLSTFSPSHQDVLLVYYASWCGFCINLAPVLLTVARFFKSNKHVTIARIDADQNDLPWQHTVAAYPNIILFPAKRKDFSVRYPDESERTAESLIKFILKHGTEAALFETTNDRCDSDVIKARTDHLESSLLRVEREKQLLETRLEGILMEKSLLGFKNSKLLKGIKVVQEAAKKERDSRISIQSLYEQAEQSRSQLNEKYLALLLNNAKLELEGADLKGERHILEENSQKNLREIERLMVMEKEMKRMNELIVMKLEKAEHTIAYLRDRDKLLTRKVRLIQRTFKDLYSKHRQNSNRNAKKEQFIKELKEEKRLLRELLSKAETTVTDLKTSVSSTEKKLEEEQRKSSSVMKENSKANQQLKEMKMNYEKLTVILSEIDIPKEQRVS